MNFQSDLYVAHLLKPHQVSLQARSQCHPLMTGGQPHLWFCKLVLPLFSVKSFPTDSKVREVPVTFWWRHCQSEIHLPDLRCCYAFIPATNGRTKQNEWTTSLLGTDRNFVPWEKFRSTGNRQNCIRLGTKQILPGFFFSWTISPLLMSHCKGFIGSIVSLFHACCPAWKLLWTHRLNVTSSIIIVIIIEFKFNLRVVK